MIGLLIFVPSKLMSQDYDAIIKSKKDQRSKEIDKRINIASQKQQRDIEEENKRYFSFGSERMNKNYPGLFSRIENILGSLQKKCPDKTILLDRWERKEFSTITESAGIISYKPTNIKFSISEKYKVLDFQARLNSKIYEVASFNVYYIIPLNASSFVRDGYGDLGNSIASNYNWNSIGFDTYSEFGKEKHYNRSDDGWFKFNILNLEATKFIDGHINYIVKNGYDGRLFSNVYDGSINYYFNGYVKLKSDIISCDLTRYEIDEINQLDRYNRKIKIPELNFIKDVNSAVYAGKSNFDTMAFIEKNIDQLDVDWSDYNNRISRNHYSVDWSSIPWWLDGKSELAVGPLQGTATSGEGRNAGVAKPAAPRPPGQLQRVYGERPSLVFKGPEARGYLGVSIQDVDNVSSRELGISPGRGVIVRGIVPKQAADIAGIRPDDVILKIENWSVTPEQTVQSILENYEAGQEISVQLIRNGVNLQVMVKLGQRPSN
jgi:hypothetical protein